MVEVNYWAILVCAIISMVVGYVWYGPLFSKKWMEIVHVNPNDLEVRKRAQKTMMPLMILQFVLSLLQVFVLAYFIALSPDKTGLEVSLWAWAGFLIPNIAGNAMWNNDSKRIAWSRFWIQAGCSLVLFVIYGFVLGAWK